MKTRAAVAWKAGAPLTIETVDLPGPRAGEVLVEVRATGICHPNCYTLGGVLMDVRRVSPLVAPMA
jgi:S-(hydroxymethyl)glutathione dehydrogenase/alcohol dehydrogenase